MDKIAKTKSPNPHHNCEKVSFTEARRQRWEELRALVRVYAADRKLVPPLSLHELNHHVEQLAGRTSLSETDRKVAAIILNNTACREQISKVPFDRRLLLLSMCLRDSEQCPASIDEFGLLCEECGGCPLGKLQHEAEELGYAVLIAEGTAAVTELVREGQVDAVIGASCLSALEESFPAMAESAMPGIAVPLLKDGCQDTEMDVEWLREFVYLRSKQPHRPPRINIDSLCADVRGWFADGQLTKILDRQHTASEKIALEWVAKSGKRWRPVLAVALYNAATGHSEFKSNQALRYAALAIECFHKASLIHDDIEDDDQYRYGEETLNNRFGVPIALNVGDLLIGEGYRLIAESGLAPAQQMRMLQVVAEGHSDLCLGQGEELLWTRAPSPISVNKLINIFKYKTAPPFEVALHLGAICADMPKSVCRVLSDYSQALGIAYQINDDLDDFAMPGEEGADADSYAGRPNILFALFCDSMSAEWDGSMGAAVARINRPGNREKLWQSATRLREAYRDQAIRSLAPLDNPELKSLLVRLVRKIVPDA